MKTTGKYGQMLDEFIERSAQIDKLLAKNPQTAEVKQQLEALRAKQRESTHILETLEVSSSTIWENIGYGG